MNFSKNYKKISLLLVISILSVNLSFLIIPKKVNAQADVFWDSAGATMATTFYTVAVPAQQTSLTAIAGSVGASAASNGLSSGNSTLSLAWDKVGLPTLNALIKDAALGFLQGITQATVNWINSGYKGTPIFIADPAKFLSDTANQTIGEMVLDNPDLSFLCSPFQAQVKIALGLSYPTFAQQITCTLPGMLTNVNNAVNSASVSISASANPQNVWVDWLNLTQNPQNDPIGSYLIAKAAIDAQIVSNQNSKTLELGWGQGALSFTNCYDTYQGTDGQTVGTQSPEYIQGTEEPEPPYINGVTVKTVPHCSASTPGAIITNMLGFKANQPGETTQLQAAMANGLSDSINTILGALVNSAIASLQNGILTPASSNDPYTTALANADSQIQTEYNTDMSDVNNNTFSDNDVLGSGYNQDSGLSTTSTSSVSGVYSSDPIYQYRYNDATRLNGLIDAETEYQNDLGITENVLSTGRTEFVAARTCNTSYSSSTTFLRATEIQSNIIANIDGVDYTGNAPINWSLTKIQNLIQVSNNNLSLLNTAAEAVSSASSYQNLVDAMTPINTASGTFDNPDTAPITYVKQWLTLVQSQYSTPPCLINIHPALSISTSSLSSGTTVSVTSSQ